MREWATSSSEQAVRRRVVPGPRYGWAGYAGTVRRSPDRTRERSGGQRGVRNCWRLCANPDEAPLAAAEPLVPLRSDSSLIRIGITAPAVAGGRRGKLSRRGAANPRCWTCPPDTCLGLRWWRAASHLTISGPGPCLGSEFFLILILSLFAAWSRASRPKRKPGFRQLERQHRRRTCLWPRYALLRLTGRARNPALRD